MSSFIPTLILATNAELFGNLRTSGVDGTKPHSEKTCQDMTKKALCPVVFR